MKTWCLPAKTYSNLHLSTGGVKLHTEVAHRYSYIYAFQAEACSLPEIPQTPPMEITVTEAENPLEQMTVQERLNLSKEHYKAGAFDKAIDVLSTISADENPQAYATAQNNLGIVYRDQGKVEQAVEAWNRIPKDVPELYAKAHNNLASAYIKQGETDKDS